ncbi:MAG: YihY/virulence factor BrkB family protein [Bacteroidales bacterium]|nr:YihY/virulence factor BrkB family protein [Bacteroidales bacterium]
MLQKIKNFFEKDVWHLSLKGKHGGFRWLIKQVRVLILASRGFAKDNVQLRASALTFYSLLSIVPVFAMIFGIAKGFGFQEYLETTLKENLSSQQAVLSEVMAFADKMLANVKGGFIAGTGLVVLIWSVMNVLGNIESSFNNIWQIKKSRALSRKLSDYISLIVIAPILIFVSSGFTVSQINDYFNDTFIVAYIGPVIKVLVWFLSFSIIWFVFTLLYIIMPNTKVKFGPAFVGGIIAGTLFHILQWGYVKFQVYLSGYGAIYGSFAALPLFLMWLQYSWLIVLFGAEIAFASQNVENYEFETDSLFISNYNRKLLSLLVAHHIIKNFVDAKPAETSSEISETLDIPVRLVREIIYDLLDTNIISETTTKNVKELAYQPAVDPGNISVSYIIDKLDKRGQDKVHANVTKELKTLEDIMATYYEDLKKSSKNKLLKEL